jgi:hypothetical protein
MMGKSFEVWCGFEEILRVFLKNIGQIKWASHGDSNRITGERSPDLRCMP